MRPHRAFVENLSAEVELSGREARHLSEVLRVYPGDVLRVFDGKGLEGRAVVMQIDSGVVRLRLEETWQASRETPQPITLYMALLKGDKLADVVRAITELGVAEIVPIITQHCVVREMGESKLDRLRRIGIEAAKQCQRSIVPQIKPAIPIKQMAAVKQGFVAHPGSSARVRDVFDPDKPTAIVTGPEGGLAPVEVELLEQKGFMPVTLGSRILRAETAPVALLSLLTAGEGL